MRPDSRKRLLYLALQDPHLPVNGTSLRGMNMVGTLSQEFETDLVYMEGAGQPPLPQSSQVDFQVLPHVRERVKVPYSSVTYFLYSHRLLKAAREMMRLHHYDYIFCDYGLCALYGLILSRETGVPFIYGSQNLEFLGSIDKAHEDPRRLLLAMYMYVVEKLGVKKARAVVAITESDADYYARWTSAEKLLVIPQGIDDSIFHPFYPSPKNKRKTVLFCGNFKNQFNRNAVVAVRNLIVNKVAAKYPGVLFKFVGAYPPLHLNHPLFEFTGFQHDYVQSLREADLVISPIIQGQGFPTKIIEALAAGKTVISTPVGARAIEKNLCTLMVRTLEEFPEAIISSLDQARPVYRGDFQRIKALYSWSSIMQKLIDFINHEQVVETVETLPAYSLFSERTIAGTAPVPAETADANLPRSSV